jgi:hypothetical protein
MEMTLFWFLTLFRILQRAAFAGNAVARPASTSTYSTISFEKKSLGYTYRRI